MARVAIQAPDDTGLISDKIELRVAVKRTWMTDGSPTPWQQVDYLQPVSATERVSPGIGRAEFRFDYGLIKREDRSAFEAESPSRFTGWYVQIQRVVDAADPDDRLQPIWTGILVDDETSMQGSRSVSVSQGHQVMSAVELTWLLDRVPLVHAVIDNEAEPDPDPVEIQRFPPFNRRAGRGAGAAVLGNRNATRVGDGDGGTGGSYLFGSDREVWSNYDACEYLCRRHAPVGHSVALGGQARALLAGISTVYDASGRTLKQALDHLIPRRRGMGWCLRISGSGVLSVHVFSTLATKVSVSNVTIPANTEQADMKRGSDREVGDIVVRARGSIRYDKIRVRGARIRSMFTVSFADETLEELWSATEEEAYEAGTGTPADAAEDHDAERRTDKYDRVYQAFRIPRDWTWLAKNGEGEGEHNAAPSVSKDGTVFVEAAAQAQYWTDDRPLLRHLVLAKDVTSAPDGVVAEYRKPLVAVKTPDDTWHQVDKPYNDEDGTPVRMSVRMADAGMAFEVAPAINHVLALNHWAGGAADTLVEPVFDYEDLLATICVETDAHLEVLAEGSGAHSIEALPELVIDVPTAHYWYVVPNTVIDVTAGELVRHEGGSVRDDADRLRAIAACARAWYGQTRRAATLPLRRIEMGYPAGSMITNLGSDSYSEPVNAVVSTRQWDFEKPGGATVITTDFGELDVAGLVDFPGLSDVRAVARHIRGQDARLDELEEHVGNLPVRWGGGAAGGSVKSLCRVYYGGGVMTPPAGTVGFEAEDVDTADEWKANWYWEAAGPGHVVVTASLLLAPVTSHDWDMALYHYDASEDTTTQIDQCWGFPITGAGGHIHFKLHAVVAVGAGDRIYAADVGSAPLWNPLSGGRRTNMQIMRF